MRTLRRLITLALCLIAGVCNSGFGQGAAFASASSEAQLVIENAFILSMDPAQREPFIGYLAVGSDGTILQIGPGSSPASLSAGKHIDASGLWLLPGFVSSHSHLWQSAFTGIAANENLEGWMSQIYGVEAAKLRPEELYALTRRGGKHHLKNGITTAFNFTFTGADTTGLIDRCQLRGALDTGIRVIHGLNVRNIGAQWTFPQAAQRVAAFLGWADSQPEKQQYLGSMIAGAGAYADSPMQTDAEVELMRKFNLRNQQHYLESPAGSPIERTRYEWMKSAGMVGPNLIFGHFIHPSPEILMDAARSGVSMTWNPLSNGRLGSGIPDIVNYLEHGLKIGMGVDGEASADRADPFENMRMGLYQIRATRQQAAAMPAYDVLRMHTLGSAEVLGIQDKVGSLNVGKYADFLLLDADDFTPYKDAYAALVFGAGVEHIDSVYIGGRLMVKQRKPVFRDTSGAAINCS